MPALVAKRVADGLSRPVFAASPPGDRERLFVVEQRTGRIRILRLADGSTLPEPFLTVSDLSAGNEQGLLGLAFAPDYADSGEFYVNYTDATGATRLRRFRASDADPDRADPGSAADVLSIPQPFANHNGGWIAFGPRDGLLYVATGDGGSAFDPGDRAQNLGELLGKLLRIDPSRDDFPADPARSYGVPADNPFVGRDGARPEVFAYGLRNPWRCGFDRLTGDLYIGDVGQNQREEVDVLPAGAGGLNFGWRLKEGTRFTGLGPTDGLALVDPIAEYRHPEGFSVIGGYVYRGEALPDLAGTYFYGDHGGLIWSLTHDVASNATTPPAPRTEELFGLDPPDEISSFAEDDAGELYLMTLSSGQLFRIESAG